jgi:hypothetical protein
MYAYVCSRTRTSRKEERERERESKATEKKLLINIKKSTRITQRTIVYECGDVSSSSV